MVQKKLILSIFMLSSFLIMGQKPAILKYKLSEAPAHTFVIHFPTEENAYNQISEQSPWFLSLNSLWNYNFLDVSDNISLISQTKYFDSTWKSLSVPASINQLKEIQKEKGIWIRKVIPIPEDWYGLQVFIHLNDAMPDMHVWVNGRKIGYSPTSLVGSEWNITPYVTFGRLNTLLLAWERIDLKVAQHIIGEATIYAFPNIAIQDFKISLTQNSQGKNELNIFIFPNAFLPDIDESFYLQFNMYDRKQNPVVPPFRKKFNPSKNDSIIKFRGILPDFITWNADSSYWYTSVISIKNKNNETVDAIKYRIGFRTIASKDTGLVINGKYYAIDSLTTRDIYQIHPDFNINAKYNWIVYKLVPDNFTTTDFELLASIVQKQVLSFRNYTPIVAWQLPSTLSSDKTERLINLIKKFDSERPVLMK
jgi:hypothetical protein